MEPSARTSFLAGSAGALLLAFFVLPVLALLVGLSPADLRAGLAHPAAAPAIGLSLRTTLTSTALAFVLGTPLAIVLARAHPRARAFVEALVQLPMVLPPAVAGLGLLLAFGRRGLLGAALEGIGLVIPFRTAAVVLAETFVAAPFYVLAAAAALRALDPEGLVVARSLGASRSRAVLTVALPAVAPSLAIGLAMTWARALGEFGATVMFAGSLPGETQTLPLAVYAALESDLRAARALAAITVGLALVLLVLLGLARSRLHEEPRRG